MILYQTPWNTKHGFKIVLHFIFLISAIFPDIFHTLFEFFWENKKLSDGIFILFSARIKEHFYITFYNPGAAFFKIDALEKFTGKYLCQSLFFNNVAGLKPGAYPKRDSGTGVSYEFCEIFKNTFFIEYLRWLLLVIWWIFYV